MNQNTIKSASECFFAGEFDEIRSNAWVVYKDMGAIGFPVAIIKRDTNGWQGLAIEGIEGNTGNRFDRLSPAEKADIATIVTKIAAAQI